MTEPLIRSISDTARWVAYHRATESARPDAIFRDPYAGRLAGERGKLIAGRLHENDWAIAVRTYLFDKAIREILSRGSVDMVINLAAGLDSRPYRLDLPPSLQWVEIDLPEILTSKQKELAAETPKCKLDVLKEDLADQSRRREVFSDLNRRGQNIMVMSEGLLIYLDEDKVTSLAADLHSQPQFRYWLVEVMSPVVIQWVNRRWRHHFEAANSLMSFAPTDWRKFFSDRGWEVVNFANLAEAAEDVHRAPMLMRLSRFVTSFFPKLQQKQTRLWETGVALLRRA